MDKKEPVDILKERCDLVDDLICKYKGYILMLRKGRGKGSEPADIDLIDFKGRINYKINIITDMIDRRLNSFSSTTLVKNAKKQGGLTKRF